MLQAKLKGLVGIFILALVAAVPVRAAEEKPRAKAYIVLVGIDKVDDKQILPREHAEADAKALYDVFTNPEYLGVEPSHIRLLLGNPDEERKSQPATQANIMKAVRWLADKAGRDDEVVFAFFGQGAPLGERTCYFASNSTFKGRDKNAVAAAELEQELDKLKSERLCVFLDVNFKGFDSGKDPAPDINLNNLYKEFLGKQDDNTNVGRILFLANTGLKPSLELEKHGLFAGTLLKALKGAADKEGYEPDGLVTIDELTEYLDKEIPPLVRKHGKTKEEKEQNYHILGGRSSHFVLTQNPALTAKVRARLDKLAKLLKDKMIDEEQAEEGQNLLSRMPKLEAHRTLRKDYQQLVDGTLSIEKFTKERAKILEGMKFKRGDAEEFATKVIRATQHVLDSYVKNMDQAELINWAIRGLYQQIDEKIPQDIKDRLDKIKDQKEPELTRLLSDVRERLGNREDLDKHKDIDFALQHMLKHLDPYTTYIDPENVERMRQETESNFTGIGIQIRKDPTRDMLMVISPIRGSPAYKAGLKAGDLITQIKREMDSDGKPLDPPEILSTKGLPLTDAVKKILGKENTKVKLTVEREGEDKPREFEITRGLIEVDTVLGFKRKSDDTWDFLIDPENRICYIRLSSFAQHTTRDLVEVLDRLNKKGIKGMILDLRFNPGGLLSSAVTISDLFIDDGLIVSIRPRIGKEMKYNGETDGSLLGFPMVCLVNGSSASGSEIVAGCLQDHQRAVIVGERSYGKGSVQNIQSFEGGKLKMTTASFWRPNGKNLNKSSTSGKEDDEWGVGPDKGFLVKLSAKEREDLFENQHKREIIPRRDIPPKEAEGPEYKDKQLEKAMDYLRGQIKLAAKDPNKKAG